MVASHLSLTRAKIHMLHPPIAMARAPRAASDPFTPSSRPIQRPTSSGESDTSLVLIMAANLIIDLRPPGLTRRPEKWT
jgi:hypothetical protein